MKPDPDVAFRMMTVTMRIFDLFGSPANLLNEFDIREGFTVVDYGCGPARYVRRAAGLVVIVVIFTDNLIGIGVYDKNIGRSENRLLPRIEMIVLVCKSLAPIPGEIPMFFNQITGFMICINDGACCVIVLNNDSLCSSAAGIGHVMDGSMKPAVKSATHRFLNVTFFIIYPLFGKNPRYHEDYSLRFGKFLKVKG